MEAFWGLFLGVFFAETVKNIAKGSANMLQERVSSVLQPEFVALNLNADDTSEQIQRKLEEKPQIKEIIRQKIQAQPDLLDHLIELFKKQALYFDLSKNIIHSR